jgi:hypothetical protein
MRIDPAQHGWTTAPETILVMEALGDARFVGGPVAHSATKENRRRHEN